MVECVICIYNVTGSSPALFNLYWFSTVLGCSTFFWFSTVYVVQPFLVFNGLCCSIMLFNLFWFSMVYAVQPLLVFNGLCCSTFIGFQWFMLFNLYWFSTVYAVQLRALEKGFEKKTYRKDDISKRWHIEEMTYRREDISKRWHIEEKTYRRDEECCCRIMVEDISKRWGMLLSHYGRWHIEEMRNAVVALWSRLFHIIAIITSWLLNLNIIMYLKSHIITIIAFWHLQVARVKGPSYREEKRNPSKSS